MKQTFKKALCIILALAMVLTMSVSAFAETGTSVIKGFRYQYSKKGETIVESGSFTDIDGEFVNVYRTVEPDGSGILTITKGQENATQKLSGQNYEMFEGVLKSYSLGFGKSGTRGTDVTGTQYKHVYVSSMTFTERVEAYETAADLVNMLIGEYGVLLEVAWRMVEAVVGNDGVDTVTINQVLYEVHFTYDDSYYTHCYHNTVYSYDSGGHLIDTTKVYYQAVGG